MVKPKINIYKSNEIGLGAWISWGNNAFGSRIFGIMFSLLLIDLYVGLEVTKRY
jgi:hypothetical protein